MKEYLLVCGLLYVAYLIGYHMACKDLREKLEDILLELEALEDEKKD